MLRCFMMTSSTCGQRAAVRFFIYFSLGLVRVCEIEITYMVKNNRNPDLVCENISSHNI